MHIKHNMKKLLLFPAIVAFNQSINAQCTLTPVISQTNINCYGNTNGAAAVSMPPGYTYTWSNAATTSSISNLAAGNYSVIIASQSCIVSATELVVNGDFTNGNTGFNSSYLYKTPPNTAASQYWVAPGAQNSIWNGAFANFPDHTNNSVNSNFMKVNGSGTPNTNVWCESITVTPNTNYNFSAWLTSLYPVSPAQLQFYINGNPVGATFTISATVGLWSQFFTVWNSGGNNSANICVVNQNTASGGNDFAIDDISFRACNQCTYTANFTITQPPALSVTANAINGDCVQKFGTLNSNISGGNAPYSYLWSPGGYTTSTATVATGGTYSLQVTDANGCQKSSVTSVAILTTPTPVISSSGPVCVNGVVQLNSGGGNTYYWMGPNGFTSTLQNPQFTATTTAASGVYTVVIAVGTCSASAATSITINGLPNPKIIANSSVCANSLLNISGQGGNYYAWTGPNGFNAFGANPVVQVTNLMTSGVYTLTVNDQNGCTAKATKSITIYPTPDGKVMPSKINGCAPLCITFNSNATNDDKVYWTLDNNASANTKTAKNCYTGNGIFHIELFITNKYGCSSSGEQNIEVYPKPVADFNYGPLKPVVNSAEVNFTDASHGATINTWEWYFNGANKSFASIKNPSMNYPEAGQYPIALVITSDKGCVDTVVKTIVIGEDFGVYIPDAFSPNGDGLNDVFQPKGSGIAKYELKIFDRWGEMLMTSDDFEKGWDGWYKGKLCKQDTYIWKITLTNILGKTQNLTGKVTLLKDE